MKQAVLALLVLAVVSTLSAACVDLSDGGVSWGTAVVNDSATGILHVNENTSLCPGTYYLDAAALAPAIKLNASGIYLDCNQSIIDGIDKDGYGVMVEETTYNGIENCTVGNYEWGIYLLGTNYSRVAADTPYNNTEHGIKLQDSANNTVINNVAYNNTGGGGIQLDTSTFNNISNNTAYGNAYGIILSDSSHSNNIVNNTAYNSTYAFVVITAQYNLVENNTAYGSRVGYLLSGAENNSVVNNEAYNITGDGVSTGFGFFNSISFGSSNQNNYSGNTAHDCQSYGFDIHGSDRMLLAGNTAYNNSAGFFLLTDSSTVRGNEAYNNTGAGISAYGNYSIMADNVAYGNGQHGIVLGNSTGSNLSNSTLYLNGNGGLYLLSSAGNLLNSTLSYGNFYGIYMDSGPNNTIVDTVAYNNSDYGLYSTSTSSGNNFTNTLIYNQSYLIFQADTASPANNFTNLTLGYNSTIGLLNYQFLNLTYNDIDSTVLVLDPYFVSLNDATTPEADRPANITVYTERCNYVIWKKEGFPHTRADIQENGTIYTPSYRSACTQAGIENPVTFDVGNFSSAVEVFSGYTLGGYVGCVNLSDEYTYGDYMVNVSGTLNVNENTTLCGGTYEMDVGLGDILIFMNSSGIHLDCNESTIDGLDGQGTGMMVGCTGLCSVVVQNDTVRNCTVRNYAIGFYVVSSSGDTIMNNTAFNNSLYGFVVSSAVNSSFVDNAAANNSGDGFYITASEDNNFTRCVALGNVQNGFTVSDRNRIVGCTAYGNGQDGFYEQDSYSIAFLDSISHGNTQHGFNLDGGGNHRLLNITAYGNAASGFYLSTSTYSTLENSTTHDNTDYGIYVAGAGSGNLTNNTAYRNGAAGVLLFSADGAIVSNITLYNNTYDFIASAFIQFEYNMTDARFLNPSGTLENYTTLDINDIAELLSIYTINWSPSPAAPPSGASFEDKFVNISGPLGSPSIDYIAWKWAASETSGYQESGFTLWGYNTSWVEETATLDTASHMLYVANLVPSSVYGIFDTFTQPSARATSTRPSSSEALSIIAEDEVPAGTEMTIIVERGGHVTLPNALVTITFGATTVFTGYTDSWGRVYFTPENAGVYRIAASKLGYTAANDSFTASAPAECASNGDCAYDEQCTDGMCRQIPEGGCGTYSNHSWGDYGCCASSDCGEGFSCTNHECVQRETEPEGCTIDSECAQGYRCESGNCVLLPAVVPPECVEDGDCQSGFVCSNTVCVEAPPGEPAPVPEEPQRPTRLGGLPGAILNLWWLWLIIILLAAWYLYDKSRKAAH